MSRISVSQTMAVSEKSTALREQGVDVIDFGAGEPDFPTPENIKQAAIRAIDADFTKYTAIGGIKELRKAIVEKHARDFGSKFDLAESIVNVGGKHSIFNIVSAVVEEGDDVMIPTPYWVSFADIARYAGANLVFAHTREQDGFRLTADLVERSLTPKTRLIVANSPCNPSGAVIDDREFERIAAICRERGIYLLTDECYAFFLYDGRRPFSIASRPEFKPNVIVAGSLSKTYAMTGWRIGFTLAEREIVQAIQKAQVVKGRPHVIVAHTVKGKGVSFMENNNYFHGVAPTPEEMEAALRELDGDLSLSQALIAAGKIKKSGK